jgi:hypothetical protein
MIAVNGEMDSKKKKCQSPVLTITIELRDKIFEMNMIAMIARLEIGVKKAAWMTKSSKLSQAYCCSEWKLMFLPHNAQIFNMMPDFFLSSSWQCFLFTLAMFPFY